RTHEVEGAVVRSRAESHQHSVLTESSQLVADALFSLGRRSPDRLPELCERGSLAIVQGCQILVDGLKFNCHVTSSQAKPCFGGSVNGPMLAECPLHRVVSSLATYYR